MPTASTAPARAGRREPRQCLPDACPHCRGRLVETGTADQFQTEIPRTPLVQQFRVHIWCCESCGKRTQGRHPLQTSDALGAAASQIGPDAQAAAAVLHTQMGLSHGKVAFLFQTLFGIKLARGASTRIDLLAAARLEPRMRSARPRLMINSESRMPTSSVFPMPTPSKMPTLGRSAAVRHRSSLRRTGAARRPHHRHAQGSEETVRVVSR
jgi:hypothetical protein